jgi:hypothetical protein
MYLVVVFFSSEVVMTPNDSFGLCHYCILWAICSVLYVHMLFGYCTDNVESSVAIWVTLVNRKAASCCIPLAAATFYHYLHKLRLSGLRSVEVFPLASACTSRKDWRTVETDARWTWSPTFFEIGHKTLTALLTDGNSAVPVNTRWVHPIPR